MKRRKVISNYLYQSPYFVVEHFTVKRHQHIIKKAETIKERTNTEYVSIIETDSKPGHRKVTILYDYKAKAGNELILKVGETITDITVVEEGWCKGKLNCNTGVFPENFVKSLEEKTPPSPKRFKKEIKRTVKVNYGHKPTTGQH